MKGRLRYSINNLVEMLEIKNNLFLSGESIKRIFSDLPLAISYSEILLWL